MQKITNPLLVMSNWKKEKIEKAKANRKEIIEWAMVTIILLPFVVIYLYFVSKTVL